MAHLADHLRREARAPQEAREIGGHDDGNLEGREPLNLAAQTQQGALQTVADHQHEHAEKQGP